MPTCWVTTPLERFAGTIIAAVHLLDGVEDKLVVAPEGVSYADDAITGTVRFQERFFESVITH